MNKLPTPEITSDNYQNVYDYYASEKMHKIVPYIADLMTASIFHPEVVVPEETRDFITDSHRNRKPIILVANHVQYQDHNVVSAAIHGVPLLRKMVVGNTLIFAKAPYFQEPKSRWYNELANVVPVFREIDIKHETGIDNPAMEVGRAASVLLDMTVKRIAKGQNLFLFPEGTRNRKDWEKVQSLEAGIGHIAFKAWHGAIDVNILPIGIAYHDQTPASIFKPVVYFGDPILSRKDKPRIVTATVQSAIQDSVDQAYNVMKCRKHDE